MLDIFAMVFSLLVNYNSSISTTITPISLSTLAILQPLITSQTDRSEYGNPHDTTISRTNVTISGVVDKDIVPAATAEYPNVHAPMFVSIWVFNPDGKTLLHSYSNITRPNLPNVVNWTLFHFGYNYSYSFDLNNQTMVDKHLLVSGDYEVVVIYNKYWHSFSNFRYTGNNTTDSDNQHYFVLVNNDNQTIPIQYNQSGGVNITIMELDSSYPILYISGTSEKANSSLTVQLPRNLIDSKGGYQNETDTEFSIFNNGGGEASRINDISELHSANPDFRILKFNIEYNGTFGRAIYGTQVMPEFNQGFAMIIMAAGMLAVAVILRRQS
jgi:hypothetical protein